MQERGTPRERRVGLAHAGRGEWAGGLLRGGRGGGRAVGGRGNVGGRRLSGLRAARRWTRLGCSWWSDSPCEVDPGMQGEARRILTARNPRRHSRTIRHVGLADAHVASSVKLSEKHRAGSDPDLHRSLGTQGIEWVGSGRPPARKPGSWLVTDTKLRTNTPAPASKTTTRASGALLLQRQVVHLQ